MGLVKGMFSLTVMLILVMVSLHLLGKVKGIGPFAKKVQNLATEGTL